MMDRGRFLLALLLLIILVQAQDDKGFVSIFNGESFEGWEGNKDYFRIEDGSIVAGRLDRHIPNNEFLCTQERYADFELRLQFRVSDNNVNAGVQLRSERVADSHEVSGYQADIGQKYWGNLYDESRRNVVLADADMSALTPALNIDGWNEYVIRCEGARIRLWINGILTVDYAEEDGAVRKSGIIGLQIHGGPAGEAHYKDLKIKVLE